MPVSNDERCVFFVQIHFKHLNGQFSKFICALYKQILIAINYVAGVVILVILKIAIIAYSLLSTGNAGASLFGYRSLNSLTSRSYQPLPHNNHAN